MIFEEQSYIYGQSGRSFISKVYAWMCVALAITSFTAWYIAHVPALLNYIMEQPFLLFFVFLAQLGLVIALSAMLNKLSFFTALVLFIIYAISMGVSLSLIFYVYTFSSIVSTFIITSGMFGGMALYGYFTGTDLMKIGNIAIMVLLGLILAMFINMLFQNAWVDYVISIIGVALFSILTAIDSQRLKEIGRRLLGDAQTRNKAAIVGALTLYLDFINLFLFLLRFTGNSRNQ